MLQLFLFFKKQIKCLTKNTYHYFYVSSSLLPFTNLPHPLPAANCSHTGSDPTNYAAFSRLRPLTHPNTPLVSHTQALRHSAAHIITRTSSFLHISPIPQGLDQPPGSNSEQKSKLYCINWRPYLSPHPTASDPLPPSISLCPPPCLSTSGSQKSKPSQLQNSFSFELHIIQLFMLHFINLFSWALSALFCLCKVSLSV